MGEQQPRLVDRVAVAADPAAAVEAALAAARAARAGGDAATAIAWIEQTLRAGAWRRPRLWAERLALMETPEEYAAIKRLWLASPARTHSSVSILRSVARAAAAAGEHDDARLLLRKAIRQQHRVQHRPRAMAGRARRAVLTRLPVDRAQPQAGKAPFEQAAAVALGDLDALLAEHGVHAFLISGTLLGYVRDGGFISWDKDIDVGVLTDDLDADALHAAFERSPTFLIKRLDFTSRLRVNHANGVAIDVFPHYRDPDDPGRVWHDGTATRWWNSPFGITQAAFLGRQVWVPEDPERYLDENYGDWRTPQPHFDARLDAPNVQVTNPEYFDTLAYFGLLDGVTKRDARKRERFATLLRELGEGDWVAAL